MQDNCKWTVTLNGITQPWTILISKRLTLWCASLCIELHQLFDMSGCFENVWITCTVLWKRFLMLKKNGKNQNQEQYALWLKTSTDILWMTSDILRNSLWKKQNNKIGNHNNKPLKQQQNHISVPTMEDQAAGTTKTTGPNRNVSSKQNARKQHSRDSLIFIISEFTSV